MPKYTKYLEFSQKERTAIRERDNYRCIFCQIGYGRCQTVCCQSAYTAT